MAPVIHLVPQLGAVMVVVRYRTGEVLVLVDADEPWRRIVSIVMPLLPRHERREVYRALLAC